MAIARTEIKTRPLTFQDLDSVILIDRKIRASGKAVTYANLTTEQVFTIDKNITYMEHPVSYVDLIKGRVQELFKWGLVAEVEGHVRGFILGETEQDTGKAAKTGVILILGVHPEFQHQGVATALVNALMDEFRANGIRQVRVSIDERDKELLNFAEKMGFGVGKLLDYRKAL